MTRNLLLGMNGMKDKAVIGPCDVCCDDILETQEFTSKAHKSQPSRYVYFMHIDCCSHTNCGGNYEDVYCKDCGADYNNGRLW